LVVAAQGRALRRRRRRICRRSVALRIHHIVALSINRSFS
jgi:hypothetical protein